MKKIALIAAVAFVFTACKDKNRDLTLTQPGSLSGNYNSSQANAGKTTTSQLPATNAIAGAGTNPAHGQPGHRCDLDVGAPLPSASSLPNTPVPQVTTTQTPVQPVVTQLPAITTNSAAPANNAKPSGNLNPAHGQPGHRCEIAVGAPLNSAPAAKQNNSVQNVSVQPVNNPAPAATLPGMNPQHGQPGHRCDIAVGAPLNSPATAKVEEKRDTSKN